MLSFLLKYIKRSINFIAFYIVVLIVLWVIDMILPYISGFYIDQLVTNIAYNKIILFLFVLALINIIKMIGKYFRSILITNINSSMTYQMSCDIFQKIFKTEYKYYSNIDCAYQIDKINKDTNEITHFFTGNIMNLVLQLATIFLSGIILYRSDIVLCFIIFALLPVYVVTFYLNKYSMYQAHSDFKEKSNKYFSVYMEQLSKLSYIKRNALFNEMNKRLEKFYKLSLHAAIKSVKIDYIFTNLNQVIVIIAYLCIVGIGGYKVSIGELSIGHFSIINTYFNMIIKAITYFLSLAATYQDASVSYNRLCEIINKKVETYGDIELNSIEEVWIDHIRVYTNNNELLKSFTYKFEQGKIYGITGKNGVGKTTLLNVLLGLYGAEYSGSIKYNSMDIEQFDLYNIRKKHISYVEQEPMMFNMSVKDYLKFGCECNEEFVCNQNKFLCKFEAEYLLQKEINENGNNLSGGEKQKLALIKALSKGSSLMLLDEPSSALDKKSTELLISCLNEKKKKTIIILISHDPKLIELCDTIIELE